jgi:hypothetical protein
MKRISKFKQVEYLDYISYKKKKYIREESIIDYDHHTISWVYEIPDENKRTGGPLHYYSIDVGWSKDDKCNKNNPAPKIEIEFQKLFR